MDSVEIRKVLCVEDDLDTQAAVRLALQGVHQLQLRLCSSARECLQAAAGFPADLLLLDVMMPEIDGPTLLAGLRQQPLHHHTPAIFLTSLVDPEDLRYYDSLGVAGVIPKPFDPMTLGERIIALLTDYRGAPPALPPLSAELEVLHRVFARELPVRMDRIRDALNQCRKGPVTRADCTQLWELIEDLRNSANAYGNHRISDAAYRAEQRVAGLVLSPERRLCDLLEIEMDLMGWAL